MLATHSLLFVLRLLLGPAPTSPPLPLLQSTGSVQSAGWRISWSPEAASAVNSATGETRRIYERRPVGEDASGETDKRIRLVAIIGTFVTFHEEGQYDSISGPYPFDLFSTIDLATRTEVSLSSLFTPGAVLSAVTVEEPEVLEESEETADCPACEFSVDTKSFVVVSYSGGHALVRVRESLPKYFQPRCGSYCQWTLRIPVWGQASRAQFKSAATKGFIGSATYDVR